MEIRKNWNRILGLLLIVVLVYWSVNNMETLQNATSTISSAFMPFIIGGALAFILNLPMKMIENLLEKWTGTFKKWYRIISVLVSLLIVSLVIYALIFLVIPDLQQTISSFIDVVPETIRSIVDTVTGFINENPNIVDYVQELDINFDNLQQQAINTVQSLATGLIGSTLTFVSSTVSSVVTIFIAFIFAIYLLSSKEALVRQAKKFVYSAWALKWSNYIVNVGKKANKIFSNFVGGQLIQALIWGVLLYVGMWILGFPYRLSISAITAALSLIPIYGAFLGGFIGFVLISVVSFSQGFWFVVFFIILQQIEGNLIYPYVVGDSVGLPGIWVLLVVTVAGSFFGLLGMLVAVPVVSLIYSLISATVNHRLQQKKLDVGTESSNLHRRK